MAVVKGVKKGAKSLIDAIGDLWYHGSDSAFRTFDPERLGTGEGGRDTKYGFYLAKRPNTAEAYLPNFPEINPSTFKRVHGFGIDDAKARLDDLLKQYADSKGITPEQALDYNHPDYVHSFFDSRVEPIAHEYKKFSNILSPYTYQVGHKGISSSDWLRDSRMGYVMGAEIPLGESMRYVDMGGQAWDEGRQAFEARAARDEGYRGVIFQDMVDDALSGVGADDIALVFDPRDINTRNVTRYGNIPDVDFGKLKSGAIPTAAAGLLGGAALTQSDDASADFSQTLEDRKRQSLIRALRGNNYAPSVGSIEGAKIPFLAQTADTLDRIELPIIGKPVPNFAEYLRKMAYGDKQSALDYISAAADIAP